MTVRAFFSAVTVPSAAPPYNTITLKVYYPAAPTGSEMENMTGVIPADQSYGPMPVVIFMPGINVEPQAYHWLVEQLAASGRVVVTYLWVAEEMPGYISVTPGVTIDAVRPGNYGGAEPSCPALQPILDHLAELNTAETSRLNGLIDLDTVILGGHSAGGTMALQSVNPAWFPQVKGAFTYGAHMMTSTMLGYEPGTVLPIYSDQPLLMIGGMRDGVIEASTIRYGLESGKKGGATLALQKTFDESISGDNGNRFMVILSEANHFTVVSPLDQTTGRPFLDHPPVAHESQIRATIKTLIESFLDGCIADQAEAKQTFLNLIDPSQADISHSQRK